MLGGLGNIGGLLKQAKAMQERMATIQKELANRRYQADSGGGAVTATVDGRGTLVGIKIQPDATEDVELLEDLVTSAVRAASAKAQQAAQQDLAAMTGGMNIPGLSDLLGGPGGAAVG